MENLKIIDDDFIKNIALFMLKHNMQEECEKYHLAVKTLYNIVKGKQQKVRSDTYSKIIAMLNGEPLQQDKVESQIVKKVESTSSIAKPKAIDEATLPKSEERGNTATSVTDDIAYLKEAFKQLKMLVELNQDLTKQLSLRVESASKGLEESAQRGLDNFERQSKATNKRVDDLETQFETFLERHKYVTSDVKKVKERVKSLEIQLNPTKFGNK